MLFFGKKIRDKKVKKYKYIGEKIRGMVVNMEPGYGSNLYWNKGEHRVRLYKHLNLKIWETIRKQIGHIISNIDGCKFRVDVFRDVFGTLGVM